jgi:hypothetical protein
VKLELLAQVLQTAGLGTIGTDIFVHHMEGDDVNAIMLRTPLDGIPIDPNLPDYYHHDIYLTVRAPDYVTGDAKVKAAVAALTISKRSFVNGSGVLLMHINEMIARTLPRNYPRLDSEGIEWAVDIYCNYVMPADV